MTLITVICLWGIVIGLLLLVIGMLIGGLSSDYDLGFKFLNVGGAMATVSLVIIVFLLLIAITQDLL